jgi:sugar phosphate isomerase/epimerase
MSPLNRRQFFSKTAIAFGALSAAARRNAGLLAEPLGLPIGLELYTVRNECEKDLEGTVKKVAEIGYKEVEMYSFYKRKPSELRSLLSSNGLVCPSAHYETPALKSGLGKEIDFAKEFGLSYMICAFLQPGERKSLDDYRGLADLFNKVGEQCQRAGIQFAYHNHNFEFKTFDGVSAYDELLRRTDSKLVQLELDCYWITRAGKDPLDYFKQYPGRFPLWHIKDRKPGYAPATDMDQGPGPFTEVGRGSIDWPKIFSGAREAGVKHYYVEQDFCERPPLESAKISYDYLKGLKA